MINWAIRYQPIVRALERLGVTAVVEIGSGPEGLGLFWRGRVLGVDRNFTRSPLRPSVCASVLALPLPDRACPVVVSCDMLEHLPPAERRAAVVELSRIASRALLLAFPSGAAAEACYRELAAGKRGLLPGWLREHLEYGLPDASEVTGWLSDEGWAVAVSWHESVRAHVGLMRWEMRRPIQPLTYGLVRAFGPWLAERWPTDNRPPLLRALLCARRVEPQAA